MGAFEHYLPFISCKFLIDAMKYFDSGLWRYFLSAGMEKGVKYSQDQLLLFEPKASCCCFESNARKHHAQNFEHKLMYLLNPTVSTILPYIKLHRSNKQIVWAPFDETHAIIVWFVLDW